MIYLTIEIRSVWIYNSNNVLVSFEFILDFNENIYNKEQIDYDTYDKICKAQKSTLFGRSVSDFSCFFVNLYCEKVISGLRFNYLFLDPRPFHRNQSNHLRFIFYNAFVKTTDFVITHRSKLILQPVIIILESFIINVPRLDRNSHVKLGLYLFELAFNVKCTLLSALLGLNYFLETVQIKINVTLILSVLINKIERYFTDHNVSILHACFIALCWMAPIKLNFCALDNTITCSMVQIRIYYKI